MCIKGLYRNYLDIVNFDFLVAREIIRSTQIADEELHVGITLKLFWHSFTRQVR